MNRGTAKIVLGGVAIVLFAAGIWNLFHLRFESGDIYPPYSSLRADPLGTKVFYQSLKECGVAVERSFVPPEKLTPARNTTVFFLGHNAYAGRVQRILDPGETSALRNFIRSGGRVVVTLLPRQAMPSGFEFDQWDEPEEDEDCYEPPKSNPPPARKSATNSVPAAEKSGLKRKDRKLAVKPENKKPEKSKADRQDAEERKKEKELQEAANRWMEVELAGADVEGGGLAVLSTNVAAPGLPTNITCHTAAYFSHADPAKWQVIYHRRNMPVIIERKFGKGSLVLATPTYFVSNEAMRNERQTGLLMWLMDGRKTALFDEYSHGVSADPNTATLLRAFRLHWFIASMLVLAFLFMWKSSFSLVPPREEDELPDRLRRDGRDSLSGLVNLLRRNVGTGSILGVAVARWKHNLGPTERNLNAKKIELAEATALTMGAAAPVEAYNEICRIVHQESQNKKEKQ